MEIPTLEGLESLVLTPGILLGMSAILLSIIAILISRRNSKRVMTKIAEVKEVVDLKTKLRRLASVVSDMTDSLNRNLDLKLFSFHPIRSAKDEVVSFIHDKGERESVLDVEPVSLRISFLNGVGREEDVKIESAMQFEKFLRESSLVTSALVNFRFSPDIITNNSIELTNYIQAMKALSNSWEDLSKHRDLLGAFNHSILDWLAEEVIHPLVQHPIEHFTSSHKINLRWLDKSEDVQRKLLEALCGYDTIEDVISNRRAIALERLQALQKSIILEGK